MWINDRGQVIVRPRVIHRCVRCEEILDMPCIDLTLNGVRYCPNCLLRYILKHEDELPRMNVLTDDKYTYKMDKKLFISFMRHNLTNKQYFELIKKYPNSFELHCDFYDSENGNSLQPNI